MRSSVAVLDVGGTSIKLGAVDHADGHAVGGGSEVRLGEPVDARSAEAAEVVLDQLGVAARATVELCNGTPDALVLAFPGPFDLDGGRPLLRGLTKFESIYGMPLRPELRRRLGPDAAALPIVFVRDSEAAGVGESVFGAGRSATVVLTIALGTGMGTCLTRRDEVIERVGDLDIERLHTLPTPWGRADDVLSARGLEAVGGDHAKFGTRLGAFVDAQLARFEADGVTVDRVVIGGGVAGAFDRFAAALPAQCVAATAGAAGPLLGAAHLAARHH